MDAVNFLSNDKKTASIFRQYIIYKNKIRKEYYSMTYENICNLKNGGFPKTFQDLSLQFISEMGNNLEEPLTSFKYYNLNLYYKLKDFDYDKDAIASMLTQVALSSKLLYSMHYDEPIISYHVSNILSNIVTIPVLLLSSKDEDGSFYKHNTYIDIVNYYYIVANLPIPRVAHEVIEFARIIFNELVHHNDKFKKVILRKPTECYIDSSARRKSLIVEKIKHDERATPAPALSFEKLANDLGADDISVIYDFPILPYTLSNFPFDRLKVIKFLSDFLYDPIVQKLEFMWIDTIFLTPINILSNDIKQKDEYFNMVNYYYKIEHITDSSKNGNIKKISYIIRSIRNMLQFHSDTFGTNNNKNINAVNSNVRLVPVERKGVYSPLFQTMSFIRKDIIGGNSKDPMFYKVSDCDGSSIRYKITQASGEIVTIVKNQKYNGLTIKSIKSDNDNTLKYEVIFGINNCENYDELIQFEKKDSRAINQYLICTQLRLNKDYQLTSIEPKQDYSLKCVLNPYFSKSPLDTIQIGIRWPFGIDRLNTALRNGYITFILTVIKK